MDHTIPPKEFKWTPGNLINENFKLGDHGHVCVVLNRQIQVPAHVVKLLWRNGKLGAVIKQIPARSRLNTHPPPNPFQPLCAVPSMEAPTTGVTLS